MRKSTFNKKAVFIGSVIAFFVFVGLTNGTDTAGPINIQRVSGERIEVNVSGKIEDMLLEEYLIGVVAAEMPASYESEALKAQAVAARTYTVRRMRAGGCSNGGCVCTDSSHCQAYSSKSELQKKWGNNFDVYYGKVSSAVRATQGKIIEYEGEAIDALYHAGSGGATEDSENVYSSVVPYLRGVSSSGDEFEHTETFSRSEFISKANSKLSAGLTDSNLNDSVKIISRYSSGRVENVRVGGAVISGKKMRSVFALRSANFKISIGNDVKITTYGYGHGLGMSQSGANQMAKEGSDYMDILNHYYTGISVTDM